MRFRLANWMVAVLSAAILLASAIVAYLQSIA